MEKKKTKWAWLRKFGYAFRGLYSSIKEETTLVVDIIAGVTILIVATILNNWSPLLPVEWAVIVLMIGVVIGTELLNTAIENLVDVVTFKYNYAAKKIKDVSAAATLILSIVAIVVGLVIFIPHIISLFH